MYAIDLKEAEQRLPQLIEEAGRGEQVIITREDGSAFQIVPFIEAKPHPTFGSANGLIKMSDDFDAPLSDFEDYGL